MTTQLGWKRVTFRDGIIAPCVMCGDLVSGGVVPLSSEGLEGTEGFRCMCSACYTDVMSSNSQAELDAKRRDRMLNQLKGH